MLEKSSVEQLGICGDSSIQSSKIQLYRAAVGPRQWCSQHFQEILPPLIITSLGTALTYPEGKNFQENNTNILIVSLSGKWAEIILLHFSSQKYLPSLFKLTIRPTSQVTTCSLKTKMKPSVNPECGWHSQCTTYTVIPVMPLCWTSPACQNILKSGQNCLE